MICNNPHCFDGTCKGECRLKSNIFGAAICAFAILIGAGCKSMPYLEDARIGLTGIDLRFHEPKLPIEEQGFFGNFQYITNRMESAPMPVVYPRLMNMNGEIK